MKEERPNTIMGFPVVYKEGEPPYNKDDIVLEDLGGYIVPEPYAEALVDAVKEGRPIRASDLMPIWIEMLKKHGLLEDE